MVLPGHVFADHLRPPSPIPWKQQRPAGGCDISEGARDVSEEEDFEEEGSETASLPDSSTASETSDDEEQSLTFGHRLLV